MEIIHNHTTTGEHKLKILFVKALSNAAHKMVFTIETDYTCS